MVKHKHYFLCYDLNTGSGTERCHHNVDLAPGFVDKQLVTHFEALFRAFFRWMVAQLQIIVSKELQVKDTTPDVRAVIAQRVSWFIEVSGGK